MPRRAPVYRYRDRRHWLLWGTTGLQKIKLALLALVSLALVVALLTVAIHFLKELPRIEKPVGPETAAPTPMATQTPVAGGETPRTSPAPTATPTPTPEPTATRTWGPGPTPLTLTGPDVTSAQPSRNIASREDLIAMFRWMIKNGQRSVALESLGLEREEILEVALKYSNYFKQCGYNHDPARIAVRFQTGVQALVAVENNRTGALDEATRRVLDQAREVVDALIEPGMSDLEKELVLYDYVTNHCEYAPEDAGEDADSALGFFENGLCRCAGYVDTFRLLARLAGLEVEMIGGPTTRDLPGERGHAWNLIRLDGLWYAADPTWDDMLGGASGPEHVFFNLPYTAFGDSRSCDMSCCPPGDYAAAVDEKFYYGASGYAAADRSEALSAATEQLERSGEARILFTGTDDSQWLLNALSEQGYSGLECSALSTDLKLALYRYAGR